VISKICGSRPPSSSRRDATHAHHGAVLDLDRLEYEQRDEEDEAGHGCQRQERTGGPRPS